MPQKKTPRKKAPASRVSRPALERIQRIHRAVQAGEYPNCNTLAAKMEISRKTVWRDIEFMRDRQGLPLEFDPKKNGYYYSEPVSGVPMVQVTEGEVLALYVAQKVLQQYKGTLFEKPLNAAFEKLTAGLQDTISFPLDGMDDTISIRNTGTAAADLEVFQTLHHGVTEQEEVRFQYKALRDRTYKKRLVHPYHLLGAVNCWYLIGFDINRSNFRVFSLPRIRRIEKTGRTFERFTNFNPKHLLQGSLGVYIGEEAYKIRVRFDSFAAQLIREREWHESQKLKELPNDEVELTLTLSSLFEVERWILSWGPHARVIDPPELQDQILAKAEATVERYKSAGRKKPKYEPIELWDHDGDM